MKWAFHHKVVGEKATKQVGAASGVRPRRADDAMHLGTGQIDQPRSLLTRSRDERSVIAANGSLTVRERHDQSEGTIIPATALARNGFVRSEVWCAPIPGYDVTALEI